MSRYINIYPRFILNILNNIMISKNNETRKGEEENRNNRKKINKKKTSLRNPTKRVRSRVSSGMTKNKNEEEKKSL